MVKATTSHDLKEQGRYEDDWKDWMDGLPLISFKEVRQLTIRPVSHFILMARHWPQSLQSGKTCPPMWCSRFNSLTQKFDSENPCCLHDDFGDRWRAQRVIIFCAIVREWQEEGKRNPVGILVLPGGTSTSLKQINAINKYDIADPAKGCDLSIIHAKEAAPAQQWQIQRTDRTPLNEDETAYKVPNLEKLSPDFDDPKYMKEFSVAMRQKLTNISYYVTPKPEGGDGWGGYKKDVKGQPYTDFPELAALVGDGKTKDAEPKRRSFDDDTKTGKTSHNRLQRKHDIIDDDDDDDDDDGEDNVVVSKSSKIEDDTDEPAPPSKVKKKRVQKTEEDDDIPPFDTEEAPKPKKTKAPTEYAAWSADPARDGTVAPMLWKTNDEGAVVPKCWGVFAGAPKCRHCPVRKACMSADA